MPSASRRLAAFVVALALGLPATAAAQSAGDDQYEDPFGGQQGGGSQGSQGGGDAPSGGDAPTGDAPSGGDTPVSSDDGGGSGSGGGGTLPPGAEPAAAAQEPAAAEPASGAGAARERLPYTGADGGLLALGGTLLLASGVALRVRLRDDR